MAVSIKRALLIGINYITNPNARLYGCIEDIKNVQNMLIDAYGYPPENIVVLRDDMSAKMPTKQNIILGLQMMASVSGPNDELWIHYSGHGTQLPDRNGDEPDGADEAIVPVDYPTAGMIADDDLFNIVRTIRCKTFLVFDSCHSGSVCDLQYSINYVNGSFTKSVTSNKYVANPNIILLSGCRDAQTSADAYDSTMNEAGGALTMSLTESLRKNKHAVDIMKVYNDLCYLLMQGKFEQIPVLSSSRNNPVWTFSRPVMAKIATISKSASVSSSVSKNVDSKMVVESKPVTGSSSPVNSLPPSIVFQPKQSNTKRVKPTMGLFM
jgi:hypothetical protein